MTFSGWRSGFQGNGREAACVTSRRAGNMFGTGYCILLYGPGRMADLGWHHRQVNGSCIDGGARLTYVIVTRKGPLGRPLRRHVLGGLWRLTEAETIGLYNGQI